MAVCPDPDGGGTERTLPQALTLAQTGKNRLFLEKILDFNQLNHKKS